jgi:hypothetical protein
MVLLSDTLPAAHVGEVNKYLVGLGRLGECIPVKRKQQRVPGLLCIIADKPDFTPKGNVCRVIRRRRVEGVWQRTHGQITSIDGGIRQRIPLSSRVNTTWYSPSSTDGATWTK